MATARAASQGPRLHSLQHEPWPAARPKTTLESGRHSQTFTGLVAGKLGGGWNGARYPTLSPRASNRRPDLNLHEALNLRVLVRNELNSIKLDPAFTGVETENYRGFYGEARQPIRNKQCVIRDCRYEVKVLILRILKNRRYPKTFRNETIHLINLMKLLNALCTAPLRIAWLTTSFDKYL